MRSSIKFLKLGMGGFLFFKKKTLSQIVEQNKPKLAKLQIFKICFKIFNLHLYPRKLKTADSQKIEKSRKQTYFG